MGVVDLRVTAPAIAGLGSRRARQFFRGLQSARSELEASPYANHPRSVRSLRIRLELKPAARTKIGGALEVDVAMLRRTLHAAPAEHVAHLHPAVPEGARVNPRAVGSHELVQSRPCE